MDFGDFPWINRGKPSNLPPGRPLSRRALAPSRRSRGHGGSGGGCRAFGVTWRFIGNCHSTTHILLGGEWLPWILNFPRNIGLRLSSQLTHSYFSEGWPNHQPDNHIYIYINIDNEPTTWYKNIYIYIYHNLYYIPVISMYMFLYIYIHMNMIIKIPTTIYQHEYHYD